MWASAEQCGDVPRDHLFLVGGEHVGGNEAARRADALLAAALGGLDAVVFTAGIGENQPEVRRRICADAGWLGVEIDEAANARGEQCISAPGSHVAVYVLPTDEELMIARHVAALLG